MQQRRRTSSAGSRNCAGCLLAVLFCLATALAVGLAAAPRWQGECGALAALVSTLASFVHVAVVAALLWLDSVEQGATKRWMAPLVSASLVLGVLGTLWDAAMLFPVASERGCLAVWRRVGAASIGMFWACHLPLTLGLAHRVVARVEPSAGGEDPLLLRWARCACLGARARQAALAAPLLLSAAAAAALTAQVWALDCSQPLREMLFGGACCLCCLSSTVCWAFSWPLGGGGSGGARPRACYSALLLLFGAACCGAGAALARAAPECRHAAPELFRAAARVQVLLLLCGASTLGFACCCRVESCLGTRAPGPGHLFVFTPHFTPAAATAVGERLGRQVAAL